MHDQTLLLQKIMIRFGKTGPAIYHSHHDMIRFWERAVKRADMPMRHTQGFNPRPRMVFPHALGVGIASRHEAVVLELCRPVGLDAMLECLRTVCGDTLDIMAAENLPPVKKSPQIVGSSYRISGFTNEQQARLPEVAEKIMAMPEIMVERGAPGEKRSLDIRPFVASVQAEHGGNLAFSLVHSQTGSARPDEIAKTAAETFGADWRDWTIEKTGMTLE